MASNPYDTSNTSSQPVVGEFEAAQVAKGSNSAADLVRQKIQALYKDEPNARQEITEAAAAQPRSKHQQFMYNLSISGRGLAEIQTEWHNYYVNLPDNEKHEVWQEFYQAHNQTGAYKATAQPVPTSIQPKDVAAHIVHHEDTIASTHAQHPFNKRQTVSPKNARAIKQQVLEKVAASAEKTRNHHGVRSVLFGISTGVTVLLILLLGLFNELVITPFIQPSRAAEATPIIFSSETVAASEKPEVIIPKINVQIPVDYTVPDIKEETIQNALNEAVVHYPNTVKPGEKGNAAIFGHSSNNIFNKGKYKFAFVLLSRLEAGDVFYLTYNKQVYAYKVYDKKVVEPTDTWVLNPVAGKTATATLITCDPPGTSLRRLVVWGEQITPNPDGNIASSESPNAQTASTPGSITGNGPTLGGRIVRWINPFD